MSGVPFITESRMIWSIFSKLTWLLLLVVASCGSTEAPSNESAERWRQWFERRQFGEDPYFFFPSESTGPTGCPENRRLSYAGSDSSGVQLSVIDERGSAPEVRARCSVRFTELQGSPQVRALPDGRVMWALRAVRDEALPAGQR